MANEKYNKQDLEAMRVMALLQGIDPNTLAVEEENNEDIEINIEGYDSDGNKIKGKKSKEKKSTRVKGKQVSSFSIHKVPMISMYENLKKELKLTVEFNKHDIPYKEQLWAIPRRTVKYRVSLATGTKEAKDISDKFNNNSLEERKRADNGEVRYYAIVTDESVKFDVKMIGYVKVEMKDGKLHKEILVKKAELKRNNVNPEKVSKDIKSVLQYINKD